jgi:uncharacterized membrane protein
MLRWPHDGARLPLVSLGLTLAGIAISTYLTVAYFRPGLLTCTVGGCETVQSSRYAEVAGVPIAVLGLGMYLALAGLCVFRLARPEQSPEIAIAVFAMALAGSVYAAYLTYVELAVIDAICQWCVLFAFVTWALLAIEGRLAWLGVIDLEEA